ncbi:hypothetical protein PMI42_04360 [Bradyrhizobium sp. YR681]|uniref:hypothetical protein n=1 Tax=Bradyrhizobium sp. YR681 TaxID=1144344 RepID=UPI0002712ACC|nr:hypothetical protein [Bradyrhizobium sp. YR681]EJN12229.1 hypothetical protein PMI42_04360 [Bradyrhizobium sp. YR681]
MQTEMFDIVNYDVWGDLVKKWARDAKTRPATIAEFEQQLDQAGVMAKFPQPFTEIVFIQPDYRSGTLLIKLPDASVLAETEKELMGSANYPLPLFYTDDMKDSNLENDTPAGRLLFHSKRVGEYTIKFCG